MSSLSRLFFYLLTAILLFLVFSDEVNNTFLINESSKLLTKTSAINTDTVVYLLLILQILFSPIQAGLSDYYLRRKSLIFSTGCTLLALIFFQISVNKGIIYLLFAILIKGVGGNTLPIAWAGIADITKGSNFRFILALSICALAIGSWGTLLFTPGSSLEFFFTVSLAFILISIFLSIYPFKDTRISEPRKEAEKISPVQVLKKEIISIFHLSKTPFILFTLICFLFSEISFYQVLFRVEVLSSYTCFAQVPLSIGLGYMSGTAILGLLKTEDKYVCLAGLIISFLSIFLISISFIFEFVNIFIFIALFSCYSLGFALFTPSLFSMINPKEQPHLQGKIYGILESTDSLASLLTFCLVFFLNKISCGLALLISTFFIFLTALLFPIVYKKTPRKNLSH